MDIAERIRRARFVRIFGAVLGTLASLIAVTDYARTHSGTALAVSLVLALAVLVRFRRELAALLRYYRRDILFLILGAALGGAGTLVWSSRPVFETPKPVSGPIAPAPLLETPAPQPAPSTPLEIVYRTPSGERYHRATCGHVRGKAIPLSLQEAGESGLTPCRACNPAPLP